MDPLLNFSERTILVTGATSGIGFETSKLLAGLGARIVLVGRNADKLQTVLTELNSLSRGGITHRTIEIDLEKDWESLGSKISPLAQEMGGFHGFFHSAGLESLLAAAATRTAMLDKLMHVSVHAGLFLTKAFLGRGVLAQLPTGYRPSFVMMSSVASLRGQSGMTVYSATKGALDAAVRSLAVELAPKNIRVNSIAAGAVETPMHSRISSILSEDGMKTYSERHPLGFGTPADIAKAAAFLLSDASQWITGTTLVVDGGYTCR